MSDAADHVLELHARYARYVADALKLQGYKLHVQRSDDEDGEDYAEVVPTENRKVAVVTLHRPYFEASPVDQRNTLVHEFVHVILHPWRVGRKALTEVLSPQCYAMFDREQDAREETATDHLADAVSPLLATPEQWAKAAQIDWV